MRFREVETNWDDLPAETREHIVVTAWAGYRYRHEHIPIGTERNDFILGYATDLELLDTPSVEEGQTLTLVETEELPPYTTEKGVNIADSNTLVSDLVSTNVRRFRRRYYSDSSFREWIRTEADSKTHEHLLEELGDDHEIGDLLREDLGSDRSE